MQKKNIFTNTQNLLKHGEKFDASIYNRVKNYYGIEENHPFFGTKAKGSYLWDADNNKYIDYILGYGTIVLGHAHPIVTKAVIQELKKGNCISPLWKSIQLELTELITSVIPNSEMAYLMKTGSDTTTGALRLARIYTGRNKVIRFGYNGWHDWATPRVAGIPEFVKKDTLKLKYNCLDSLERLFNQHDNQIACIVMMPFELEQPDVNYLANVKSIAHKNGALFILDEMRSGFRLALGGAQEFFNIEADLATYSKSMSNGYPISAIVGKKNILNCLSETKMSATYFGTTHEMAAAIATIKILQKTDALEKIWYLGNLFKAGICELINDLNINAEYLGYPPYPFIKFKYKNEDKLNLVKKTFFTITTNGGILLHPNHHWYICASHSENDIIRTLKIFKKGFTEIKKNKFLNEDY